MRYTIEELKHLRNVRLKGFDKDEMLDDNYTNEFYTFKGSTDTFLVWLEKMEKANKIPELLSNM